jgi:uracil-DNA glycosylase
VDAISSAATELISKRATLPSLRRAAKNCRACDLYKLGTQTVFGSGDESAQLMLVGEQPGDQEDLAGEPFVGPAGRILDKALAEVGISREEIYLTNAVKHFKWRPAGKRRIHEKPNGREVRACRPWLEAEIQLARPQGIVCLGATAAQALLGRSFRLTQHRGEIVQRRSAPWLLATVHPSSILRIPDRAGRHEAYAGFVADLAKAVEALTRR